MKTQEIIANSPSNSNHINSFTLPAPHLLWDCCLNPRKPVTPRRLKVTTNTQIGNRPIYAGSVVEFDISTWIGREVWTLLQTQAVKVPLDTPLVLTQPKPPALSR